MEQNQGYVIFQSERIGKKRIVMGFNENAPSPYVTWKHDEDKGYYWGHYFGNKRRAMRDFRERVRDEKGEER